MSGIATEDDGMTQDAAAMSAPSAGSVAGEPVAYQAVDEYGRPYGFAQIVLPFGKWPKSQRVPLYAKPQDGVVRLPRLLWDSSERMGKGEWDYQQRVKAALEVAGVKWVEIE